MDDIRIARIGDRLTSRTGRRVATDETIEAHYASLERGIPCYCYGGYHYIGHMVEGDEEEIFEAVPCRRCGEELRRLEERLAQELMDDEERQELRDRVLRMRRRVVR